jgi:hypothetical protein
MRGSRLAPLLLAAAALAGQVAVAAAAPDPVRAAAEAAVNAVRERLDGRRTAVAARHYVSLERGQASLLLQFRNAPDLELTLEDGHVYVDGRDVATYVPDGRLEASWRDLLSDANHLDVVETVRRLRRWEPQVDDAGAVRAVQRSTRAVQAPAAAPPAPQPVPAAAAGGPAIDLSDLSDRLGMEDRLRGLLAAVPGGRLELTVPGGEARLGDFSVGSSETHQGHLLVIRGSADIYGRLVGNLVTVDGDVVLHRGAVVQGDVLAIGGRVRDGGGEVSGEIASLAEAPAGAALASPAAGPVMLTVLRTAGLAGILLTLAFLGFALVLFGRPQLETVSDTVVHSFGRAFVTGLVGQALVVPTFGMLVVGLALSIVGVLLIPFVVIAYALLVVVGLVGGLLAVAHAMGETYTRRRMAAGADIGSPNSFRYLLVGLAGAAAVWATWVIVGWVPVAGNLVRAAAILFTWLLGTAGFGAMLLSRAGLRENFAGRLIPPEALTDEYLWATPQFGVPAVKRPTSREARDK